MGVDIMVAFVINPSGGVFRAVKNGDNALAPSTPSNVIFDAYGNKLHGMSFGGIVTWSQFAGPSNYTPQYAPQAISAQYWGCQINFPEPLDYVPFATFAFQDSNGDWSPTYNSGNVTVAWSGGGGFVQGTIQGTAAIGGGFATTSYVFLSLAVIKYQRPVGYTPFQAASYRLFGV